MDKIESTREPQTRCIDPENDATIDELAVLREAIAVKRAALGLPTDIQAQPRSSPTLLTKPTVDEMAIAEGLRLIEQKRTADNLGVSSPIYLHQPSLALPAPEQYTLVKTDVQMAREAVRRGEEGAFAVWSYARQMDEQGAGCVPFKTLRQKMCAVGCNCDAFYRRLKAGIGVYFQRITKVNGQKVVFYTGYRSLAARFVEEADTAGDDDTLDLILKNKPGGVPIYVDLSGSLHDIKTRIYAAWLSVMKQDTPISRVVLCKLLGVSLPTLLSWEKTAEIECARNYGFDTRRDAVGIEIEPPEHWQYQRSDTNTVFCYGQLPNTYIVRDVPQKHDHRGMGRKVRKVVNQTLRAVGFARPVENGDGLADAKVYYTNGDGRTAYQHIDKHLRKPETDTFKPRFARVRVRGRSGRTGFWERSIGMQFVRVADHSGVRT